MSTAGTELVAGSVVRVTEAGRAFGMLAVVGEVLPIIDRVGRDTGERIAEARLFVIDSRDGSRFFLQDAPVQVMAGDVEAVSGEPVGIEAVA